ncbi:CDP-alcohol phosphatidyltransferase family protein [Thermodesulforhabdus norvegica]|uniref:Phosphatidylglycerophosphate synthase n=1 Tax=Thermodesulforhabdus norvegica TaxID=39841 RepID=A0A1I4RFE9_9BACT|nr:CDP-alcohol phosphatidyltransferase family protein [Thermodesulforhabdus norvegica]SFM50670.1 Phosphatidylglycerophosphate synthase [Thermodesulforhabdus norvegica]
MAKWQNAVILLKPEETKQALEDLWFVPGIVRILANLGKKGIKKVHIIVPESTTDPSFCVSVIKRGREIEYFPSYRVSRKMPSLKEPFLIVSANHLWQPKLIEWFEKATGSQYLAAAVPKGQSTPVIASIMPGFERIPDIPLKLEIPDDIICHTLEEFKEKPGRLISLVGKPTDRPHVVAVRHLLFPFLTLCANKKIHPNKITWLGFLVHLVGCLILLIPGYLTGILAASILIFSWILDCADGTLARLTHRESDAGRILDTRLGHLSNLTFFAALLIRTYPPVCFSNLFITILLVLGIVAAGYLQGLVEKLPASEKRRGHDFLLKINHRDYAFVVLLFALFNALTVFVWIALLGTYCYAFGELLTLVGRKA